MGDYRVSNRFSRDVVELLVSRGMNLTGIAALLDVSKSYISRVRSGTRSLTLDHLATLEEELGRPVALLLMEAIPRESVSAKARPLYDATWRLLRKVTQPPPWGARKPARRRKSKRAKAA